ncbi:MAG: heme-degrading domain-containing protein [Bacillota bacterium]|nr:heme-degrading domain-containing protein [Bacillota bacterium]
MNSNEALLDELRQQEETFQFYEFSNETAFVLGLNLVQNAKKNRKPAVIDISRYNHQLFHYSCEGSLPEDDCWIVKMNRVVHRFNKSSLHFGIYLKEEGKTIQEKYGISSIEYAPHGGAFPIRIKNVGIIGTITVTGLPQEENHNMVVNVLREYLKVE